MTHRNFASPISLFVSLFYWLKMLVYLPVPRIAWHLVSTKLDQLFLSFAKLAKKLLPLMKPFHLPRVFSMVFRPLAGITLTFYCSPKILFRHTYLAGFSLLFLLLLQYGRNLSKWRTGEQRSPHSLSSRQDAAGPDRRTEANTRKKVPRTCEGMNNVLWRWVRKLITLMALLRRAVSIWRSLARVRNVIRYHGA